MEKSIYEMELFEEKVLYNGNNVTQGIIRVPGGWIYMWYNNGSISQEFIPFNNEFQETK